jgi:hypothetical protein
MHHSGARIILLLFVTHGKRIGMAKLKSRDRFPPGGFSYLQPETQWRAPNGASFETVVAALIQHRIGNPYLVTTHGWPTDLDSVRNQVDSYNAQICKQLGYTEYILEGPPDAPVPKTTPLPIHQKPGAAAAGGSTLVEWIASGAEAVPREVALKRAEICATCPKNGKGDFTRYFTIPVSEAIRHELNRKNEWKLQTPYDDQLKICEACLCPIPLKIHVPLKNIMPHMDTETISRLDPRCWITKPE